MKSFKNNVTNKPFAYKFYNIYVYKEDLASNIDVE